MPDSAVVVCSDVVPGLPATADIEDLFDPADYARIYGWAFQPLDLADLPATAEPIVQRITQSRGLFDHALPAHALTQRRGEFFSSVSGLTIDRFEALFVRLNQTLT